MYHGGSYEGRRGIEEWRMPEQQTLVGARCGGRGLTWTESRSSFVGKMAKPFFRCSHEK